MSWLLQILFSILTAFFAAVCIRLYLLPSPNPELLDTFVQQIFYTPIAHRGGSIDAPENTVYGKKTYLNIYYKLLSCLHKAKQPK